MRFEIPTALVLCCLAASGCPAPVASTSSRPGAASGRASGCDAASLSLPPEAVVATLNGAPITMEELGSSAEEKKALAGYCDQVNEVRERALDELISRRLVDAAAAKDGKSADEFLRARIEAATPVLDDAAVLQFYNDRSGADSPPFEAVRDQVVAAMQREAAQESIRTMLDELRKDAQVQRRLPDVRPPAVTLAVPEHAPVIGAPNALVTVTEFADFECPYCSQAADTVRALKDRYQGRVRFVYRHFPLSFHPNARAAAEVSQCAQAQGRFWDFHDRLYQNAQALDRASLVAHAEALGLDRAALDACMASGVPQSEVQRDTEEGQRVGVSGTPTFFINGRAFKGMLSPDALGAAIEEALAGS